MRDRLIPGRTTSRLAAAWAAILLLHAPLARAQLVPFAAEAAVAADTLLGAIAALDARYFNAYNGCELEVLDDLHTEDLEAYHDLGGGPVGWETVKKGLERNVCAESGRVRRELVPGTLRVYPIHGFGAVQLADHLFYEADDSGAERPVTAARLIVLWRRVGGDWKVSRMISYDHQPATPEGAAASSADTRSSPGGAGEAPGPKTVHVAPPTGVRETDRASILAALARATPDDTIRFGAGSYLVGEVITIATPHLTLLGHPSGTVLRGCEPAEFEAVETRIAAGNPDAADFHRCGLLALTGGHTEVRGLTFELSRHGLMLGCCHAEARFREAAGGYRIQGNTFRESVNGVRLLLDSPEPTVIRGNRFINTFHAMSAAGSHIHFLDNFISAPEPRRVPGIGHPSFAIAFAAVPQAPGDTTKPPLHSEHNIVADNRIEGHPEGILLSAYAGSVRRNEIRGNTVIVRRVPLPSRRRPEIVTLGSEADSTIVGVALHLYRAGAASAIENNLIEGNHLSGADGLAIVLDGGRRNRVLDNTISGVRQRDPFSGNTLTSSPERWRNANGSGIWVSPGSEENEIRGNAFEDIAADAIVLEGDRNQVENHSEGDRVRDLGTGNRVSGPPRRDSAKLP